jgi:tetratricopeptide (TPR) repeat protein
LLEFDSDSVDAHSLLGDLYLKKGAYPQAVNEFHAALESAPDDTQVQRNLVAVYHQYSQILERQKRYREAIDQLQRGLALEPEHINLRLSLAYVYQNTNAFDEAKVEFEKILEIDADNSQAKTELINLRIRNGNYLLNRKQYTAALKEFEGIPESARNAGIYNTIGYLYLMKKQPLKALPAFDAALADQGMDDVAYQNLRSIESQFDRQFDKINDAEAKRIKDSEPVEIEQSEVADTGIEDSDEMKAIKNKLVRVRGSLVNCLIGRDEHLKAKAKYRATLELVPTDSETKAILIDTGIFLAQEFQRKKWPKNMKEVIGWIQEYDPENSLARKLPKEAER